MNKPVLKSVNNYSNYQDIRYSKMGYEFNKNANMWRLDNSKVLYWKNCPVIEKNILNGFRNSLCRWAEEQSASYTVSIFSFFCSFWKKHGKSSISVVGLTNYQAQLDKNMKYKLGLIRSFLFSWHEWGFQGIEEELIIYLDEITIKGNKKGKAVKGRCPYTGPFTMTEQGALLDWASNAFNEKKIDLEEYTFFLALMFTGRRMTQIRYLRACDLIVKSGDKGGEEYVLNLPRIKQRAGFRKYFRSIVINEDLYLLFENLIKISQGKVERHIGKKLSSKVSKQIPIFINEDNIKNISCINSLITSLEETPDNLHMTYDSASKLVQRLSVKNTARSERTGEFINFSSRRFRYTKGTNLARRGISGTALAYALDHTDTQHINAYVENTPEMAEQIDKVMAKALSPLAQAFVGKLISSERNAIRANDPHSRIKNCLSHTVGNCGTYAFCISGYRACYTCVNFQPWLEAPHSEVLEEILEERNRQVEIEVSQCVIQSTDRLLLALQQVIDICQKAKNDD